MTAATWWNRSSSAVSVGTWMVTVAVAGLWLFYGLASHDLAIAGSSALSVSTAALILLAETSSRPVWLGPRPDVTADDVTVPPDALAPVVEAEVPTVAVREPITGELAIV